MDGLTDAKRRVLDLLKRSDALTAGELATELELTEAAVRQHLDALAEHGLVAGVERTTRSRGRPPTAWSLTDLARELFPDRHADLTVELIGAIRAAVGEEGLNRVIAERNAAQLKMYRALMPKRDSATLRQRVNALAQRRTAEGYMAEVRREGDHLVLIEHHCPVCDAATACQGLCKGELNLFRAALGRDVNVERTAHLLSGDQRCVYEIRSRG